MDRISEGAQRLRVLPRTSYVTLGAAMRQLGLTARALRYYEEVGLIEADRDRLNCRRYDERAMDRLRLIAQFREAGLDVRDIRLILDQREESGAADGHVECAAAKLTERLAVIEAERRSIQDALASLQQRSAAQTQDRGARSAAAILRQARPRRAAILDRAS